MPVKETTKGLLSPIFARAGTLSEVKHFPFLRNGTSTLRLSTLSEPVCLALHHWTLGHLPAALSPGSGVANAIPLSRDLHREKPPLGPGSTDGSQIRAGAKVIGVVPGLPSS